MKSKRFLPLLTLALLAFTLVSCDQKKATEAEFEKVQHFRHLLFTESPWDPITGIHPISAEEAANINNYTFTYDDAERLVQVAYGRGDSLLPKSRLGASRVVITYEENLEIRNYFDEKGNPATWNGDVFKAVYELNEEGFRTGLKFYDEAGEPVENRNQIAYYTWYKDVLGKLVENRYNLAGEETVLNEFCPFYELRFTYDEAGRVTNMANYEADTMYDCVAENCGNIGVCYFDFVMDDNNNLLEFTVKSTTGQLSNLYWGWARFEQTFDENGYMIERVLYDQDDELLSGKKIPIIQNTYDEAGALVEQRYLDADRQLMESSSDSVAVRKYTYDEYGHLMETVLLDKDLNPKKS